MIHHRYFQSIASLACIFAAYTVYGTFVVPWIEPVSRQTRNDAEQKIDYPSPTAKYRPLIESLFAQGSWECASDVHVLKVQDFFILFRKLEQQQGRLHLEPCTFLHVAEGGKDRTWIVQAAGGATVEFDRPLNWQSGEFGEVKSGFFPGRVLISGSATGTGHRDRIEIDTQGVQFSREGISTTEAVHFRFGDSFGSGRDLSIRMVAEDRPDYRRIPTTTPMLIRQVELVHVDQVVWRPSATTGLPGWSRSDQKDGSQPPLQLTADGPFTVDFHAGVAKLTRKVIIQRGDPQRMGERLHCEELLAYFGTLPVPLASRDKDTPTLPNVEFERLVAKGQPAILEARTAGATARWYRLVSEQFDLVAGDRSSPGQIIAMGKGEFQTGLQVGRPELSLRWKERVELLPHDGLFDLTVVRDAVCKWEGTGTIRADSIWLQMVNTAHGLQPDSSPTRDQYQPKSLIAESQVQVQTDQLQAETDRLDVHFAKSDTLQPPTTAAGPLLQSPEPATLPNRFEKGLWKLRSQRIQIDVEGAKAPQLRQIVLEGDVRGQRLLSNQSDAQAELEADRLRIWDVTQRTGSATIVGQPAFVRGGGMGITGKTIELRLAENRIWIEGPGSAEAPLPTQLSSQFQNSSGMVDVTWEKGMQFDGQALICEGSVFAQGPAQRLRCQSITAALAQPVELWNSKSLSRAELNTITASQDVAIESQNSDNDGWVSVDRAAVDELLLDYRRRTITGVGPGWIESVRRGSPWSGMSGGQTDAAGRQASEGELTYLRVDFQDGLEGGLTRRQVTFQGQVRSIVGPVQSWNQRLTVRPDGRLYPDTYVLGCRNLTVYQSPLPRSGNAIELNAEVNTEIQGRTADGKSFGAHGHRLSYDQGKDQIVMEGEGRIKAQLWYETIAGGDRKTASSQRIFFSPSRSQVKMDGISDLEFLIP